MTLVSKFTPHIYGEVLSHTKEMHVLVPPRDEPVIRSGHTLR